VLSHLMKVGVVSPNWGFMVEGLGVACGAKAQEGKACKAQMS